MATGQSLLDRMELCNQELQLQSGEADVVRGLVALNVAQDFFETRAALEPNILGSTTSTVSTTASTETTTFPSGLLRLDRLQFIDSATSRPAWTLRPRRGVGGHAISTGWPENLGFALTTGKPRAYWTNGVSIFWDPVPDGVHTIRWYGFTAASDITASGTFAYPDIVMLPLASFATRLMRLGLDDAQEDISKLAGTAFEAVLQTLAHFNRDGGVGFEYTQTHDT